MVVRLVRLAAVGEVAKCNGLMPGASCLVGGRWWCLGDMAALLVLKPRAMGGAVDRAWAMMI